MVGQGCLVFLKSANNALESCCNIGEVCNAATDDQNLAIGIWLATSDQVN
jgi:hypothetical protein